MNDEQKLALLARLLPYVSGDDYDDDLDLVDFAQVVADRVKEDYEAKGN